jgi:uncharacterized protein
MLEMDGYLAGVIVASRPIHPGRWMALLLSDIDPADEKDQFTVALASIGTRYQTLKAEIDAALKQLQDTQTCDWRPSCIPPEGKAKPDAVRQWVLGFWKAASLDPDVWSSYIDDERARMVIAPLMIFAPAPMLEAINSADDIEEALEEAIEALPRSVLIVKMLGEMLAGNQSPLTRVGKPKIGRNDSCPCGSGQKYKRCCGRD